MIPELDEGNKYPGLTRCVESCGGPGCGCFYFSSGCLFYRIFHVPTDEKIYEVFKCRQWERTFRLEMTTISGRRTATHELTLRPTIPLQIHGMIITLGAVTMPPTPDLHFTFISDGSSLAIWRHDVASNLICDSEEAARSLNCSVRTSCVCDPAESKISCICDDIGYIR
ncbi:hypothetical protein NECAME_18273 [Necator americanus]|uniref:Phlebovirus glycoprotein G2 fusion domain-containing protein n=1 Tax=Necator americanus TaxID=51031 RepID=W2SXD6_NECAM|nr:hypothetical protein NECAME_18273 [Necator americanus]ETN73531.1 hypothetical protein NECAME_18273 [Necator americanus]